MRFQYERFMLKIEIPWGKSSAIKFTMTKTNENHQNYCGNCGEQNFARTANAVESLAEEKHIADEFSSLQFTNNVSFEYRPQLRSESQKAYLKHIFEAQMRFGE